MANSEVWDVIRVPFPHTNRPVQQRRPALVVGTYSPPGTPGLLWVLMITSATHRRWLGDVEISDLGAAGLPAASIVRTSKIATIEARAADQIGTLDADTRALVHDRILEMLAPALSAVRRST